MHRELRHLYRAIGPGQRVDQERLQTGMKDTGANSG